MQALFQPKHFAELANFLMLAKHFQVFAASWLLPSARFTAKDF
jgi:hypothetical protein